MGSENHVVVDVSSDEEDIDRDYLNWLNKDKSNSTDVVEDDDDDCVLLDCDPDKTSAAVEAEADDDDDEVLVVGQKGEIACRDFPHPRHSCAKYSFNSTSHESYCDLCHCYVCDIPAPCPYWCLALSGVDHCHANDKDKTWMKQREYFRTGGNMPTLVPAAHATVSPPQSIIRLSQNPSPRNNKIEIRACSSSSSTRVANLSNVRGRSRSLSSSVTIQKDTSTYMDNLRRSRVASSGTRSYGNSVKQIDLIVCFSEDAKPTAEEGREGFLVD
ncbi:RPM1 interacting protein 13 [Raphanus sativus]|nr:RPM1 interacting protein 13 [Raphanus sativus]